MSYVQRAVTVVITAGPITANTPAGYVPATFGPNRSNTLTLAGYRASCEIDYAGGTALASMQASIYGMNLSDMNALASVGNLVYTNNNNQISILAGDSNSGMSLVFQGTMQDAVINASASPNVSFEITAFGGYDLMMNPVPPSSFSGAANVAQIMTDLASQGRMGFENNGVASVLSNPYFPGTLMQQIRSCARAANISYFIDPKKGPNGTLAIWPKNGFRGGPATPVSAQTGMIGYPRYTAQGIDVDMLFNPTLLFGSQINVTSMLAPACGLWNVYSLNHSIESITRNGDWITSVSCFSPKLWGLGNQ